MRGRVPARWCAAFIAVFAAWVAVFPAAQQQTPAPPRGVPAASAPYYPERFDWQKQTPEQARIDAAKLDAAIKFSVANENPATKDLAVDLATTFGREPFDTPIGPVKPRGALSGIVIKNGYLVAEWGETTRVDMTFSVTKTFLSTVVGSDVAEGTHSRRHRSGEGLHAARRRSGALRRPAQLEDHVGAPAAADQRLAGDYLGKARLGGSARGSDAG